MCFKRRDICDEKILECQLCVLLKESICIALSLVRSNNIYCELVTLTRDMLVLLSTGSNYALCVKE